MKNSLNQLGRSFFFLGSLMMVAGVEHKVFADDALVLPKGVWRAYFNTNHVSADQSFSDSGDKIALHGDRVQGVQDLANGLASALSMGTDVKASLQLSTLREDVALQYGLTDKWSVGIQVPLYKNADVKVSLNEDGKNLLAALQANSMNGAGTAGGLIEKIAGRDGKKAGTLGDIAIGGKYQWLNSDPEDKIKVNQYRAAITVGFKLPTGSITDADAADYSTTSTNDTKAWLLGIDTHWDYQFSPSLVLNLLTEHEYRFAGDKSEMRVLNLNYDYELATVKFHPGMYNKVELDLGYTHDVTPSATLNVGSKVVASYNGLGHYVDTKGIEDLAPTSSQDLYFDPYVGLLYTGFKVPFKVSTQYYHPLKGRNTEVSKGLDVQLQVYAQF